jgi:signal transduction histidine kinase/DNA-binding response OmpR family regulator
MPAHPVQPERDRVAYELTENIPIGTYTMIQPADGGMASFSFMSRRFLDLLGLEREVVEQDPVRGFDTVHPDDYEDWIALNVECFREKKPFYGEVRVVVHDQVRWVVAESIPRSLNDGSTIWEGALSDITAQKIAEQSIKEKEAALLKAKQNAEEQERRKSNLLAHISHEIRTPLTSLLGITELLSREPLTEYQRTLVDNLRASGDTLLGILNTALDHARLEAGAFTLNPSPFSLSDLAEKLRRLHGWAAAQAGISLVVQAADNLYTPVIGDLVRVEQILSNLIANAIRFTAAGEVCLQYRIVHQTNHALRIRFDVVDTGTGIPAEQLSQIFTPFYQASSARRVQSGTGLGLSIAKALTDLMQGTIGVESRTGKGSHFWVELPFLPASPDSPAAVPLSTHRPDPKLGQHRILLVDDSPTVLSVLGALLGEAGAAVIRKDNASDAIALLTENPAAADVLVIDLQMPGMDGFQAIQKIRADPRFSDLPILVLTAGLLNNERSKALQAGANAVLFKPVYSDQLTDCLLQLITGKDSVEIVLDDGGRGSGIMGHGSAPGQTQTTAFPLVQGINQASARRATGDNPQRFRKLLSIFCEEHQALPAVLIAAIRQQDYRTVMRRLHNLKGAARYIGAEKIAERTEHLSSLLTPYAETGHPLPASSVAYPVIADIHDQISILATACREETAS